MPVLAPCAESPPGHWRRTGSPGSDHVLSPENQKFQHDQNEIIKSNYTDTYRAIAGRSLDTNNWFYRLFFQRGCLRLKVIKLVVKVESTFLIVALTSRPGSRLVRFQPCSALAEAWATVRGLTESRSTRPSFFTSSTLQVKNWPTFRSIDMNR